MGRPLYAEAVQHSVLGSVLLDASLLRDPLANLAISDFCGTADQAVYGEMLRMAEDGEAIDLLVLAQALEGRVENAGAYIGELIDGAVADRSIAKHHAETLQRLSQLRQLRALGETLERGTIELGADPGELIDKITQQFAELQTISRRPESLNLALRSITAEELRIKEIKPREMLLNPILPDQGLIMLYSYRGTGKTLMALAMAAAVASGAQFLKWNAPCARNVLYIDGELPAATIQERIAMITAGMDTKSRPGALHIITPDLQDRPMPDLATTEGQKLIETHLEGISLVVLDNLSALCRDGKENEGEGWLPVQGWLLELRRRGISVLFLHHAGKNKSQRGTSRREDLLDTVITLKHPADYSPNEGLRCEVHFEKTRGLLSSNADPIEVQLKNGLWSFRDLSDLKDEQAMELFSHGMSIRDVAEELGIQAVTGQSWSSAHQ